MKIKSVIVNGRRENFSLEVIPMGNRLHELSKPLYVRIYTDEGVFTFDFGFVTNFRSGGVLVDFFLDQIGSTLVQLSRKLADQMLKAMLEYAMMSKFQSWLVHKSVRMFGGSA